MFKKILSTTVLGVSVLGVMAANAAAPGVYATGQIGYANTHMGSKTQISNLASNNFSNDKNLSNNGLAGRIALGYQFNQNFAAEAGYLQLGDRKVAISKIGVPQQDTLKLQQNAIDLVGKGIIPMGSNLNLYGKIGVAYVTSNIDKTTVGSGNTSTAELNRTANFAKHKWAPEAAVGVSYDITPNVSLDTSWTHIQPLGSNKPSNIDFVAVGLGYNFG
jgi:OmpA-OmpF porin, OOP family